MRSRSGSASSASLLSTKNGFFSRQANNYLKLTSVIANIDNITSAISSTNFGSTISLQNSSKIAGYGEVCCSVVSTLIAFVSLYGFSKGSHSDGDKKISLLMLIIFSNLMAIVGGAMMISKEKEMKREGENVKHSTAFELGLVLILFSKVLYPLLFPLFLPGDHDSKNRSRDNDTASAPPGP